MKENILLHIARHSGLFGEYKTSTNKLAKRTCYSQQSISRLLIDLEKQNLITRKASSKGISIRLTEKARDQLKTEYSLLKNIFQPTTKIKGSLFTGLGEGSYYTKVYTEKIKKAVKFNPYPGTLNLRVDETDARSFIANLKQVKIPEFKSKERSFGAINLYPVSILETPCAILLPDRSRYDASTIEIIAPKNLRKTLKLKDSDTVEVKDEKD